VNSILLIAFTAFGFSTWAASPPAPFVFDGCTSFSEGTRRDPKLWEHCCFEHDLFFWAGGTHEARDRADLALRDCVRATGAERIAALMYLGVRLGSRAPVKHPNGRWGNAWHERAGYRKLSTLEIDRIAEALGRIEVPEVMRLRLLAALLADQTSE